MRKEKKKKLRIRVTREEEKKKVERYSNSNMDIDAENTTNNGYRKEKRVKEVDGDVVGEYETKRLTELE